MDNSVTGHWFHLEPFDHETRWPAFAPRANKPGINAVLSTPLVAQSQPVGQLDINSRTEAAFTAKDQELASLFATEASAILTDAGAAVSDDRLARRQREELAARKVAALAEGVIMEREGVGQHDTVTTLQRFSLRAGHPLIEQTEDVVAMTRWSQPDPLSTAEEATTVKSSAGELDRRRGEAGFSHGELWLRYFELGA